MTTLMERLRRLTARRSVAVNNLSIQVFISYAHEDEQVIAGLVADLGREGIDVWCAPKKMQPGDRISREVKAAIEKARFFLVALTQHSRNSAWVAKETEYALEMEKSNRIRIIPMYMTTRDIPDVLKDHLAIDVRTYTYKAGLGELLDALRGNLAPGSSTPLARFERFVNSLPVVDEEVEVDLIETQADVVRVVDFDREVDVDRRRRQRERDVDARPDVSNAVARILDVQRLAHGRASAEEERGHAGDDREHRE